MKPELKKIMDAIIAHPAYRKAARQLFIEVEARLMILSKEYEKSMKELWIDFNKMHTVSIYSFNVILNDIERKLQIEQGSK